MITTHILDLSTGKPAIGVRVALARIDNVDRAVVGSGVTDADGRLRDLVPKATKLNAGVFELTFETGGYFRARGVEPFHPRVVVVEYRSCTPFWLRASSFSNVTAASSAPMITTGSRVLAVSAPNPCSFQTR